MTETERALRQSVTPHAAALAALDRTRLLIGAAPLTADADTHLAVSIEDLQTLVRLGDEAMSYRADTAPPSIGPRGRLVQLTAGDDRNRFVALVEFDAEDDLSRIGALIAGEVTIEPAPPQLFPANEQGEGSLSNDEDDET